MPDLHLAEIERRDSFCEVEKVWVLSELKASYNEKLPGIYQDQCELVYWIGYAEIEWTTHSDQEPSTEDVVKPMHSTESSDPSHAGEARGRQGPTVGEGTSKIVSVVSTKHVVIVLEEFSTNVGELPTSPQNLADIVWPSAPPLGNVSLLAEVVCSRHCFLFLNENIDCKKNLIITCNILPNSL